MGFDLIMIMMMITTTIIIMNIGMDTFQNQEKQVKEAN